MIIDKDDTQKVEPSSGRGTDCGSMQIESGSTMWLATI